MTSTESRSVTAASDSDVADQLRSVYLTGRTRPLAWRRTQLEGLARLLRECEAELLTALATDLGKPAFEGWQAELGLPRAEIKHALDHLQEWMRPERVATPVIVQPGHSTIRYEPRGVVLVIAPWNYPIQLIVLPMVAAIAAGNAVVAKPSELAPATSEAIARLVPRYLDPAAVRIVQGGVPETTELLRQRWDHIFFTGSSRVGRIVMQAAAEHLTPVTLELGGKSPAIVTADANLAVAARRIAWGKFLNAGQTCVAPDHVLVQSGVRAAFVTELGRAIESFYGRDARTSPDYGRLVNHTHWDRVTALIDGGGYDQIAFGNVRDRDSNYLSPTVLDGVADDAPVMGEEIFGPVLPVVEVADVDAAIARVNAHDTPLALYAFTGSDDVADDILARTSSGGATVNHTVMQLLVPGLPFGGAGGSGFGAYHGKTGFVTFSHRRGVLRKSTAVDLPIAYPPYGRIKQAVLRRLM